MEGEEFSLLYGVQAVNAACLCMPHRGRFCYGVQVVFIRCCSFAAQKLMNVVPQKSTSAPFDLFHKLPSSSISHLGIGSITTMEGFLQELIEYNTNGVKKMQEGLLEGAESYFTLGLRLLQRNAASIQTFVPPFTYSQDGLSVPVLPNKAIAQDSDFVALFDRALVLSGNELSDSCIEQKLTAYSGFFMYNFALLTHIRGLPEGNAKRLSQALHMYTLAWQALANTGEANPHVELAVLACISNMAHIHRYFHRMSEVNSCGRWIWERLQQANIPAEERSLLMSNAFFYEQKESFAAFMA